MLSIIIGGKYVGDRERFNNIVLEILRRRLLEINHYLISLHNWRVGYFNC